MGADGGSPPSGSFGLGFELPRSVVKMLATDPSAILAPAGAWGSPILKPASRPPMSALP